MEKNASNTTALAPGNAQPGVAPTQLASSMSGPPNMQSPTAPPPPAASFNSYPNPNQPNYNQPPRVPAGYANPPQQQNQSTPNAPGTYAPLPAYAQKPKRGKGCLISSLILLVILAGGIGAFVFYRSHQSTNSGVNQTNITTPGATAGTTNTPNGSAINAEQLNLSLTYASVKLTLLSVQQATSFATDSGATGPDGVVRINFQENNQTNSNPDYLESDVMLLVLPNGSTVQSYNAEHTISPDAGVNYQNWIDFVPTNSVTLSQLTLRIGKQTDNQMNIPLQTNANISKYQDQTSSPGASFKYAQVNWTIKTATLSYSYADQQATSGNLYAIVTLTVNNTTNNDLENTPSEYIRLQAGGNTVEPDGTTTVPTDIVANSTNSGIVAFLVPQGTSTFTLIMLAQPNTTPVTNQVTQNFQIS
jgi:hypothetical protein